METLNWIRAPWCYTDVTAFSSFAQTISQDEIHQENEISQLFTWNILSARSWNGFKFWHSIQRMDQKPKYQVSPKLDKNVYRYLDWFCLRTSLCHRKRNKTLYVSSTDLCKTNNADINTSRRCAIACAHDTVQQRTKSLDKYSCIQTNNNKSVHKEKRTIQWHWKLC